MKVAIEIKYPVWSIHVEAIEVDVPEGVDATNWVYEHEKQILEENGAEGDLSGAIDCGYAGIRLL